MESRHPRKTPGKLMARIALVKQFRRFSKRYPHDLEDRSRDTVAEIFGAEHRGVMNFLYCDGSVHVIHVDIDEQLYLALSTTYDQTPGVGIIHDGPDLTDP